MGCISMGVVNEGENMSGRLLSLEGISGTGKTFYRQKLEETISERDDIVFLKEIFNEAQEGLNKKIFSALYHTEDRFFDMGVPLTETMLLLARSMYKYESTIKDVLAQGKTIIEDRSIDTIALYQAILISQKHGGNPMDIAEKIYSFVGTFRTLPEKTFLLYGDADLAISRAEKRDKKPYQPEEIQLLKAVERFYQKYAKRHPERFVMLNIETLSTDQILHEMKKVIEERDLEDKGE